ncbi:MAG: DUF2029 domain-containing protein [Chloroflexi bacterium]|nr:MAG: DUF2029 domain-containing protein [Chloroflexota bacterium]
MATTGNIDGTVIAPAGLYQRRWFKHTLLHFGLVILVLALSVNIFMPIRGSASDFYPHWYGGRVFWSGETPYTPTVTRAIQKGMFGHLLPPSADQHNVAYPAYASILLLPLLLLPAHLAISVWMTIQLLALIWAGWLWLRILNWRPPPRLLIVLLISLLFIFRYPMDLFILGQFTGTIVLFLTVGVWLLLRKQDGWAGVALAASTVPPTISAPLAVVLLGGYALRGRWRGLIAFSVTMSALTIISFVQIGWWIPDYLRIIGAYSIYAPPVWAPHLLHFAVLQALLIAGVLLSLFWVLARFRRSPTLDRQVDFTVMTIISALLMFPQTGNYYFVLLILPLLSTIRYATRLPPPFRQAIWLATALAVLSPWFYMLARKLLPDISPLMLPLHVGITWAAARYGMRLMRHSRLAFINKATA